MWNGEDPANPEYGRVTIELLGSETTESPFYVTVQSGSAGAFNERVGSSIEGISSLQEWKHYAFSFVSASSGVETKFYVEV